MRNSLHAIEEDLALFLEHPHVAAIRGVGSVKGLEMKHSGDSFRERLLHEQLFILWKPIYCNWLALYLRLDIEHSYRQGLCAEEAHKQETWRMQMHQQASYHLRMLLQHSVF